MYLATLSISLKPTFHQIESANKVGINHELNTLSTYVH